MKRTLSKATIALFLALAMLFAALLNNAAHSIRPSLDARSAVISGDHAAIHVMPSPFTAKISFCFRGQRLIVWKPSIFDFYRARCNDTVGWILRERVTVTE